MPTITVPGVTGYEGPTLQRPITHQDRTLALPVVALAPGVAPPPSASPDTARLAQTGGGPPVRHDTTARLTPAIPPHLGSSGEQATMAMSGSNPALRMPAAPQDAFARSGASPVVAAPSSPARTRGTLVAIALVLLGLAALVVAVLARTGHLPR
jgi:hypothetical protein